ncbi:HlyD family efflux transporter periplasmic adaptor subunit [Albimonas sp. CAU 1670]|uniref:HlyD family secretion protein n=1 Tax=Albimonas sp. CAU 1670 TaxID=3032599 RepID=UPI0023DB741E|nr:HlyD family efflux transporter periplasmic adaptor subunit [Albimonas sp. CAU 1670]MDF2232504.1 HlyD family efflux transporter periplasmic adaptor subunit [Albimonas sp. CAU 1670]
MTLRIGRLLLIAAALLAAGYAALAWFQTGDGLPEGLAQGPGRLEAVQVDIAPPRAGRVVEVDAREGDRVAAGDKLARLDTAELEASLDRAEAEAALSRESLAQAEAQVALRESETHLALHEYERAASLVEKGHASQATLDARRSARDVAQAAERAARAQVATAWRAIAAAEAEVRRIVSLIGDSTLVAPADGRVLYRLVEPGEVVGAGQPVLVLLDLGDVYMEIFLSAREAARTAIGAEARIVLDAFPEAAIPAAVSFVAPEAQFTPKQVETRDEREKLVFRVRVRVPPTLVAAYFDRVKTGMRGVAWVKIDPDAEWPEALADPVAEPAE